MTTAPKKIQRDKDFILNLIRSHGPISRVGIYERTSLRRSTISLIARQLLTEGWLLDAGRSDNPRGPKQILLQLNPKHRFLVGLELDDELITAGVMDLEPAVSHVLSERTDLAHGRQGLIEQLQAAVRRVVAMSGLPWSRLMGIGVADPGLVDSRRGIISSCSTIDFWNDVPLKEIFEREFKTPTLIESKTRAKTIAEHKRESPERRSNMIYLDYGAGIGAGVIVDGNLLYGNTCGAGEVGHTNIDKSGPTCKCGSNGCLEALAGANSVESRIRNALREGVPSQVLGMANQDPAKITAWLVFEAARAGDKMCWNIAAAIAEDMGVAIANLVNLFNPAILILDQRLAVLGEEFLGLISRIVKSKALAGSSSQLAIRFGSLGGESGLMGVGLQVLDTYFSGRAAGIPPSPLAAQQTAAAKPGARKRGRESLPAET